MDNTWGWGSILFSITFILAIGIKQSFCDANANGDDRKVYIIYMGSLPEESYSPSSHHLSMLQQVVGDNFAASSSLVRSYKRSFNGFAAKLTSQETQQFAEMEGVVSVFPSKTLKLHTTRSWDFMGFHEKAQEVNSAAERDIIIGDFDTGIWPESESFNDKGFGPIPKKWKGECAGGRNFTCNKKIIGARYYGENLIREHRSARDDDGHGSHTASTAAGNKVRDASFYGLASGTARGGAPFARIAAYKVCNPDCDDANILAAYDDAIADGVDIITASLGALSPLDFIEDSIAIGSFHAMEKGILTVNSAGNYGPDRGSISSIAPWLLSVAANNIDRGFIDKISLGDGRTIVGQSINGFTSNGTKFALIDGVKASRPECEYPENCYPYCLDAEKFKGKILLCPSNAGILKAFLNGASGYIVSYDDIVANVDPLPSSYVGHKVFHLLQSYENSTKNPQAEILKSETIKDINAPLVANFSSRGPNQLVPEIMKPDISAPGVNILAAYPPISPPSGLDGDKRSVNYNIISGTSMSCPHVAGVAAYVKSFHPDWSPAAVKSSIMTTAKPMNGSEDKEFAYGSGHVNPIEAVNPGLVYDLSRDEYVEMLCNIGYNTSRLRKITGDNSTCGASPDRSLVRDLNYPTLAVKVHPLQSFKVSFRRKVTNVGFANSTYKANIMASSQINIMVVPDVLSFKSLKEKQSFVVTVIGGKIPANTIVSSSLIWTDGTHHVRSSIVVDVNVE